MKIAVHVCRPNELRLPEPVSAETNDKVQAAYAANDALMKKWRL